MKIIFVLPILVALFFAVLCTISIFSCTIIGTLNSGYVFLNNDVNSFEMLLSFMDEQKLIAKRNGRQPYDSFSLDGIILFDQCLLTVLFTKKYCLAQKVRSAFWGLSYFYWLTKFFILEATRTVLCFSKAIILFLIWLCLLARKSKTYPNFINSRILENKIDTCEKQTLCRARKTLNNLVKI